MICQFCVEATSAKREPHANRKKEQTRKETKTCYLLHLVTSSNALATSRDALATSSSNARFTALPPRSGLYHHLATAVHRCRNRRKLPVGLRGCSSHSGR